MLKCKYCKKEKMWHLVNVGENKIGKFKVDGEVYLCENCGRCTVLWENK